VPATIGDFTGEPQVGCGSTAKKAMSSGLMQSSGICGEKQLFVQDLGAKDIVRTSFLVRSKELLYAKNGKPYLALQLGDRTGTVDARAWERAEALAETFAEGDVVAVVGKTHLFQGRMQLVVEHLIRLAPEETDLSHYLPQAEGDVDAMWAELVGIFRELPNEWVRTLSLALLEDPDIAERYRRCPAAKSIHHAYLGGLLAHSLHLLKLADRVLPLYPAVDRSLVLFGCAFHDFGKIYELSYDTGFDYTDEGRLVGHIAIGATLIDRKIRAIEGFPKLLEYQVKHLVLAHHGKLEFGSPKRPATLEAELVHQLDTLDSRMNSIETFLRADRTGSRWSPYHRAYDQYYFRPEDFR
jgi:3'-5' exoribonuclease